MADYNPNQFTPEVGELQRKARGQYTDAERIEKLNRELDELRREIKELKGIKTYIIETTQTMRWEVEATSDKEALDWYNQIGRLTVAKEKGPAITNIKEKS